MHHARRLHDRTRRLHRESHSARGARVVCAHHRTRDSTTEGLPPSLCDDLLLFVRETRFSKDNHSGTGGVLISLMRSRTRQRPLLDPVLLFSMRACALWVGHMSLPVPVCSREEAAELIMCLCIALVVPPQMPSSMSVFGEMCESLWFVYRPSSGRSAL
jgi:hypothetical protein